MNKRTDKLDALEADVLRLLMSRPSEVLEDTIDARIDRMDFRFHVLRDSFARMDAESAIPFEDLWCQGHDPLTCPWSIHETSNRIARLETIVAMLERAENTQENLQVARGRAALEATPKEMIREPNGPT